MSLAEVAALGDRLKTLQALRDRLASDIDAAPATVTAQLASQLTKVLAEIAELGASTKVSGLDQLATRRADRLAEAGVPEPPRRASRQRR
jgi:hypothetical protein